MKDSSRMQCLGSGWWWVMVGLWLGLVPVTSMAVVRMHLKQVGTDVVGTVMGSAITTALNNRRNTSGGGLVQANAMISVGSKVPIEQRFAVSNGLVGPQSIGGGTKKLSPNTSTGEQAGIEFGLSAPRLLLVTSYQSGQGLNGSSTWVGQSLCSLGVTPGTYTWTWGTGASADSLVLTVEAPPPPPAPTVTSITPTLGPSTGNMSLQIAGTNLCGVTSITVGGAACRSFTVASPTSAFCATPAGTVGPASVVVTTPSGSNAANTLYTYRAPPPTISAVSPTYGPAAGGTVITVTGTNLTGATGITVGGSACTNLNVISATSATCETPASSLTTSQRIVVTTAGGTSANPVSFMYAGDCRAFDPAAGLSMCTVPPGVTSLNYTVIGDKGNPGKVSGPGMTQAAGGRGAKITGALSVTPGDTLFVTRAKNLAENGYGGNYSAISTLSHTQGPVVVAGGGGGGGSRIGSSAPAVGGDAGISTSSSATGGGAGGAFATSGGANGAAGGRASTGGAGGAGPFPGSAGGGLGAAPVGLSVNIAYGGNGFGITVQGEGGNTFSDPTLYPAAGGGGGSGYAGGGGAVAAAQRMR
jgi:hypothetical protein